MINWSTKYSTHKVQNIEKILHEKTPFTAYKTKLLMDHYVTCVLAKYVHLHKASVLKAMSHRYLCIYLELYFSSCTLSLVLSTLHSSFSKFQVKAIVSIEKLKLVLGLRYIGTKNCNYYAML